MSDDRFDDPSTFAKAPRRVWDGITLEEWARQAIRNGQEDLVVKLISMLPESSREKYRAIWREEKARKEGK